MSACSLITGSSTAAYALQPLETFVAAAQAQSVDAIEARATAQQKVDESRAAWAKLAPNLAARAAYTRNQFETSFDPSTIAAPDSPGANAPPVVITPQNQLDASVTLTLPIIDVGSWLRISGSNAGAEAARLRAGASQLEVAKATTRTYYQIVAADSAIGASQRAVSASDQNLKVVRDRLAVGSASELDVERARAEVERSRQTLASAEQAYAVARRSIETLSGIRPQEGSMPALESGLATEAPLSSLEPGVAGLPAVRAAQLETRSAERSAQSAYAALVPVVTASASERVTNATGFSNNTASYQFVLQANWLLDASVYLAARAQDGQRAAAAARERRTRLAAQDELFNAWQSVKAQIATARAATAQLDASTRAAKLVRDRYSVGSATQLEVTQADRDALQAEMSKIQAYADLAYARSLVKITSGRAPTPPALAGDATR